MLAVIDQVIAKFSPKQPMSDSRSQAVRDEAAEFAAQLLVKYKNHLTTRSLKADR